LALLSTLLTVVWCLLIYGRGMLNTAGSFALLSMTLFMVGMGLITYRFGFGMKQNQRSVMALGMALATSPPYWRRRWPFRTRTNGSWS